MSKRTKMLRNESEQMSEKISKDGRKVLDDMTLYIRGVDISVYDQERVRRGFLRQCTGRDTEAYCRSEGYDDYS